MTDIHDISFQHIDFQGFRTAIRANRSKFEIHDTKVRNTDTFIAGDDNEIDVEGLDWQ
jgi:hypothetical protein